MLDPQKTLEREALLKRHRELQAEIAHHERNIREGGLDYLSRPTRFGTLDK
jgi:hypothetical protein